MSTAEPSKTSLIMRAHEGGKLSRKQAILLEQKIAADPEDLDSRVSLLGYYHRSTILTWSGFLFSSLHGKSIHQDKYLQLIRWFVENHPTGSEAGLPEMYPPFGFEVSFANTLRELWLKNIDEFPENARVLGNAASFFHHTDQELSENLVRKAKELQPDNPYWDGRLSQLDSIRAVGRPELVHSALAQKEAEIDKSERVNPYDLGDLAQLAFAAGDDDKAISAAQRLLAVGKERNDKRSDYGNAVHDGNCILGRVAFRRGDVVSAKEFLLNASKSLGSPSLDTFGPVMDLAQDLLNHGERRVVIKYLWGCHRFWNGILSTPLVLLWITAITLGIRPRLNNVGNLPESMNKSVTQ